MNAVARTLRDSAAARWTSMTIVAFTMLCGYYVADAAAPLKPLIEQQLGWNSAEYGLYTSAYGWFNVFLGMLVIGGILLDKFGARFAGILASVLMVGGTALNWWAMIPGTAITGYVVVGVDGQVLVAAVGYATFGVGLELCGITATKIIARWFKDYEMALAMGLQVAIARIGTSIAMNASAPVASLFDKVSAPMMLGVLLLGIGLVAFLVYCSMDRKLDASEPEVKASGEDAFRLSDIGDILKNKGFWLIAILCAIFYSAVFPFLKYAPDLMVQRFHIDEEWSGTIPGLLPIGAMILTPVFGRVYDKKGKGATIMVLGSLLILIAHVLYALPQLGFWPVAVGAVILLGFGFSLVPSAMWPSVPRLIPDRQLGTAYALIFFIQNLIALMFVPFLIGTILDTWCITGTEQVMDTVDGVLQEVTKTYYDYTLPMLVFAVIGLLAVAVALLLKEIDRRRGGVLEQPIQK